MALNNKPSTATKPVVAPPAGATAPKAGGKRSASDELKAKGNALIAQMSEEQRGALGSKSGTLHFKNQIGLASKTSRRKVTTANGSENVPCSMPVGATFVSDEPIEIPQIPVEKNHITGVQPEDITYVQVAAGEEFHLTPVEYMYLLIRDEYAGLCEANGDPQGARFTPKLNAFMSGDSKAKLPTPAINLKQGSSKENMVDIDVKNGDKWEIRPGYERFAPLLRSSKPARARSTRTATPASTAVAVALKSLIPNAR